MFKNQFVDVASGEIYVADLISYGQQIYAKNANNSMCQWLQLGWELKKLIEVIYYCNTITSILSGNPKKYYLQKDTTCSMAQHGGKLLGYNTANLHLLNLQNVDFLCDTYQIYINKLIEFFQPNLNKLSPQLASKVKTHLNRTLLKNLIMTAEYGVTRYTAYKEFQQTLNENLVDSEVRGYLTTPAIFDQIYNYLTDGTTDLIFYKQSKVSWVNHFLEKNHDTFALNDIKIPALYYQKTVNSLYYTINSKPRTRVSINTFLQTTDTNCGEIDLQKTKTALYVNAIHALDASYLRSIAYYTGVKNIPIITIHDGFCVPFFTETTLKSIANVMFFENLTPNQYIAENT